MKIGKSVPTCSGSGGMPYRGSHPIGARPYVVTTPTGETKHFCDSDCLMWHAMMQLVDFLQHLRNENAAYARWVRAAEGRAA